MEKRTKEKTLPIEWEGWDENDVLSLIFYDVKFTDSFGCFEKDDTFTSISVNYGDGIIEAYDELGTNVVKRQEFYFTPKN